MGLVEGEKGLDVWHGWLVVNGAVSKRAEF
jgi:hypothetical protein